MKKWSVLLIMVVLVLSSLFLVTETTVAQERIVLEKLAGTVQYKSDSWFFFASDWKELSGNKELKEGDLIKTNSQGQAQLTFGNQARVLIKGNSKLKVVKNKQNLELTKVKLSLGEVLVKFINNVNSKQQFEVETPSAVAGVRGTLFKVAVNENQETTVAVDEGEVAVSSGGEEVLINKGQGAIVKDKNQKPEVVPGAKIKAKQEMKKWSKDTKLWQTRAKKKAKEKAKEAKKKAKENDKSDNASNSSINNSSSDNSSSNNSNTSSNDNSDNSDSSSNNGGSSNSNNGTDNGPSNKGGK
jgi:hypothetical protein